MPTVRHVAAILLGAAAASLLALSPAAAESPIAPVAQSAGVPAQNPPETGVPAAPGKLTVTVGKSFTIDSPVKIKRLSTANGSLVEAVAIGPREVLINGKAPGETTLIIWQENDTRLMYDLTVRLSPLQLNAVREQIARDFPDADINVTFDNDTAFVRGTVKDVTAAARVMAVAATLGKTINLLRVELPPVEPQVLLKVRFANVDRTASLDLGFNMATGAFNQSTALGTGPPVSQDGAKSFSLSSAVNLLLFRKDLNIVAAIQALAGKNLLEILAEPNVLAYNGKEASFVDGGEFPYPMVQPGSGSASVTVAFREYGVRLAFLPEITPRGTIHLKVAPEVSSLDYSHAVTLQGFAIPGIAKRSVRTEIELESGQTFVLAGLIDNQVTESWSHVPALGSIPLLGKLFQTKSVSRQNSELLIIITPEIVRPIPSEMPIPQMRFPDSFMAPNSTDALRQPGIDKTGPVVTHPVADTLPVEQLTQQPPRGQATPVPAMPQYQLVPVIAPPASPAEPAQAPPPGTGPSPGTGGSGRGAN